MASSYTDIGTELMATGENAGTWGTKTNTNIQILEEAINGYVSQALTSSGTVALTYTDGSTGDVARHAVIALTGTITGNAVVTVPANEKVWIIDNQSSGAYTVTVKVSGQTGVTWGTSDKGTKILYANGTDVVDTNIGGGVGAQDLNGEEFILDADADTSITADTDDQIDIKVGGTDRVRITTSAIAPSSSDGVALGTSSLEFADLFLADGAVINFGDDQDVSLTHVADTGLLLSSTDQLQFGDSGTYIHQSADGVLDLVSDTEIEINATTIDINGAVAMDGAITGATNITLSGELDAATLDISGDADIDGTLETDALSINGTTITSTAAELNIMDGGTSATSTTVADADRVVLNDNGTMVQVAVTDLAAYFDDEITAMPNLTSVGTLTTLTVDDITINGSTISDSGSMNIESGSSLTVDVDGGINLDAGSGGNGVRIKDDGTELLQIHNSSSDVILETKVSDKDFLIKGNDGGSTITALTFDMSAAGAATFNDKVVATELDISGDTDIDGTANLDNTDIDGTLAVDGTTISLDATTSLNIDNSNTSNGITIGTATSGVPISIGHTTSEVTVNDNLTITGDLTVNGTTTTVNSTTVTIDDPIFTLGGDTAPGSDDNKDRGIEFRYHDGSSARIGFFGWDDSATGFVFYSAATNSSEVFSGTEAKLIAGSLDISGDADIDGTLEADAYTLGGSAFIKLGGTNFANSLLIGHTTTGTLSSAEKNTGVGLAALDAITQGDKNVAVGYSSGSSITTGNRNMVFGNEAGDGLTTGSDNVNIGDSAAYYNVSGGENVAIGKSAMQGASGQSNSYNIALGVDALKNITTGGRNIGIGYQSGDNITSGSGNVMIGAGIDLGSATGARQLKIAGNDGSTTTTWISGDSDGVVTLADDLVIKDGGTIGVSSDADAITIASNGAVTFSQTPVFPDGSIAVADLDIDGATDIGEAIVDADLFIVDNGAGGTNRKVAASRLVTYIDANSSAASTGKAIAMALVFG